LRRAGLRYVNPHEPGLTRQPTGKTVRQGKRLVEAFKVLDQHGRPVRDERTLARVRRLVIPPAWRDVWICPDPNGHIQAVGRDARGRKQYRYHPLWRQERDSTKYERMQAFARALPKLRRRLASDLRLPGLPRDKVLATVVRLLETTFMRVGNEEYSRENHSYGLTTLQDRHVSFARDEVFFHFRGKSGVFHRIELRDPRIARVVRQCRDIPGHELFQYLDPDGHHHVIGSHDVNEYIRAATGQDFTAKDFRTWAGTRLALRALRAVMNEGQAGKRFVPTAKQVTRAIAVVAKRLGNTPTVCRKCYVHPALISSYLTGAFDPGPKAANHVGDSARPARALLRAELDAEERAVLALLRRNERSERGRHGRGKNEGPAAQHLLRQLKRSVAVTRRASQRAPGNGARSPRS
jgi:DNA topoisomerase-1